MDKIELARAYQGITGKGSSITLLGLGRKKSDCLNTQFVFIKLTFSRTDENCFTVDTLETYARHVDSLRQAGALSPGKHVKYDTFR